MPDHDNLRLMLEKQLQLQQEHMKDGDPRHLADDAMADFMRWNFAACVIELSEAMQEVGWKPWATDRDIRVTSFVAEMVDAFHFFMNMLLCGTGASPENIAELFTTRYLEKNEINAKRQMEGYTGLEKCRACGRDLETPGENRGYVRYMDLRFCDNKCLRDWEASNA